MISINGNGDKDEVAAAGVRKIYGAWFVGCRYQQDSTYPAQKKLSTGYATECLWYCPTNCRFPIRRNTFATCALFPFEGRSFIMNVSGQNKNNNKTPLILCMTRLGATVLSGRWETSVCPTEDPITVVYSPTSHISSHRWTKGVMPCLPPQKRVLGGQPSRLFDIHLDVCGERHFCHSVLPQNWDQYGIVNYVYVRWKTSLTTKNTPSWGWEEMCRHPSHPTVLFSPYSFHCSFQLIEFQSIVNHWTKQS